MGNLCCAREHSVKFIVQFLYTFKLHSLTVYKSCAYGGPLYLHWLLVMTTVEYSITKCCYLYHVQHRRLATDSRLSWWRS